jgi:hypothetical protein
MNLEVHEAKLMEEQAWGLHPFDRWDLLAELEEIHVRMPRLEDEHASKSEKLLVLVMGISNALVDLRMLPIQDIPQLLKIAQEVLTIAGLILECL